MGRTISVCSWDAFQHYKNRDPSWIKLYRDVLTSEPWVLGTDHSRLVQIAITLLAARYKNAIPMHHGLFRKVASLDMSDQELDAAIFHLRDHKFLEIKGEEGSASTPLAQCYAREEKSREEKRRLDISAEDPPTQKARKVSRETDPEWFLAFKLAYPDRAGDQGWRKALSQSRVRIADGHHTDEFISGAMRYAEFCTATQKTGTEFVQQAARFLGPDKPFLLPWSLPLKLVPRRAKTADELDAEYEAANAKH